MPRTSAAVDAVSGPVLEKGWSRIRGSSQGLDRQRQMTRAAVRHFPAIFQADQERRVPYPRSAASPVRVLDHEIEPHHRLAGHL